MSSSRGTIPRGTGGAADGAWTEPTAPAGRRLPSAPRERKPALAALALVLIVGGGLAAALLVVKAGHKTGAIEISQPVGQGQQIPLSAMQEVQVPLSGGPSYVPWSERGQVAQTYAASQIAQGTLLIPQMTASTANLTRGKDVLGLALKDGELPDGLQVGDHIDIYEVSSSTTSCPGQPGSTLTSNAVVLDISRPSSTTNSAVDDIQVALNPANAGAVSCNAANSIVGVAILPGNGQGASAPGVTSPSSGRTASPTPSGTTSSSSGGTG
jgi:hypothetical protein